MSLPPTYYELVKGARPFVVEQAEQDARALAGANPPVDVIRTVDDYDSGFERCIAHVHGEMRQAFSKQMGVPLDEIGPEIDNLIQSDPAIARVYAAINYDFHCCVNFALAGRKTLHISDNLAEHLANTEVNVSAEMIQLPFRTCQLVFTARSAVSALYALRGGDAQAYSPDLDYSAPVSVFVSEVSAAPLPGRKLLICAYHSRLPDRTYMFVKRELYLGERWSLEQVLRTKWEELTPDDLGVGFEAGPGDVEFVPAGSDRFYSDGLTFFRIVLNALLYISSEGAERANRQNPRADVEAKALDLKSPGKRRKVLQSANRYSALDYEEIGASIGPIVIGNDRDNAEPTNKAGGKPMVRFIVRGHWKRQAHGPGLQERKLIRIQPYYKGEDFAVTINRPYLVK